MYRKDKGKEEVFLDPNTFLKTEQLLYGIDFLKIKSSLCHFEGGSDWRKVIIMDALSKKIIEDTIVDKI
jgi:prolyl oligopeptidase